MKEFFQEMRNFLQPPQWASWQTLLALSAFSAVMASPATEILWIQHFISGGGWLFLVLATWWFIYEKEVKKALTVQLVFAKVFLGPWMVSALICIWIFGSWQTSLPSVTPSAVICWPLVSALVTIAPSCVTTAKDKTPQYGWPEIKVRQGLILLFLSYVLITCWFQFYFVIQGWLTAYPSLLDDDFSRSAFVTKIQPGELKLVQGNDLLNQAEAEMRNQLKGKNWEPDVVKWLLAANQNVPKLQTTLRDRAPKPYGEQDWWTLSGKVTGGEYDLELRALRRGPSSEGEGYLITKLCQITPQRKYLVGQTEARIIPRISCGTPSAPKKIDLPTPLVGV